MTRRHLITTVKRILHEANEFTKQRAVIRPTDRIVSKHTPLTTIAPVTQLGPSGEYAKPRGLWYGIGTEWLDWIEENISPASAASWLGSRLYRLTLTSQVLRLTSVGEMQEFAARYGTNRGIDWQRVQRAGYAGIEIAPYQRSLRQDPWYYTWDVASGCIWAGEGVAHIEQIYP